MEYKTEYNPTDYDLVSNASDHLNNELDKVKKMDKGYNKIYRMVEKNGKYRRTKIEFYTTSGFGNYIRDAETGEYYPYKVGTLDEYLFFKVGLSTGECKSENGSTTLFYLSPERYGKHLNIKDYFDESFILEWRERRDNRMREKKIVNKTKMSSFVVVK